MKRCSYSASACSILAMVVLLCGSAYCATENAAPGQKNGASAPQFDSVSLSGKVVETMDSGGYTYVRIEKKGKKTWVAIPLTKVTVGQQISFKPGAEMTNFTSPSLNRTFESIYFSSGPASPSQGGDEDAAAAMKAAHGKPVASSGEKISVAKADGKNAYTVAEIHDKKESLNEKQVVIRGKVVKVSSGIMGKNWIHLQDGTGNAAGGTNDIIATSQDSPEVGDVVIVKGTVYKDKDFGYGYKFSVIIEQASVQK